MRHPASLRHQYIKAKTNATHVIGYFLAAAGLTAAPALLSQKPSGRFRGRPCTIDNREATMKEPLFRLPQLHGPRLAGDETEQARQWAIIMTRMATGKTAGLAAELAEAVERNLARPSPIQKTPRKSSR